MKTLALLVLGTLFALPLSVSAASAIPTKEKLVYDVSWGGLTAATAVQEVSTKGDELHITSTTHSSGIINAFFKVDDKAESVITMGDGGGSSWSPKLYREALHEGRFRAQKEAQFDPQNLKVDTKDFLKKTVKTDDISPSTFDSLSCVYYIRSLNLIPGKTYYVDIYDCKRLWKTEVQVLRREEVETPLGRFKTLVVKPRLKAEGFFARTGDVTVWVTDDARRIPVKMKTKVKIGHITATLVGGSYWPQTAEAEH